MALRLVPIQPNMPDRKLEDRWDVLLDRPLLPPPPLLLLFDISCFLLFVLVLVLNFQNVENNEKAIFFRFVHTQRRHSTILVNKLSVDWLVVEMWIDV